MNFPSIFPEVSPSRQQDSVDQFAFARETSDKSGSVVRSRHLFHKHRRAEEFEQSSIDTLVFQPDTNELRCSLRVFATRN